MHKRPVKFVALLTAAGMALALGSVGADAATKKKKKTHHPRHHYSQSYGKTPAQYNQCKREQLRYPARDIRC